MIEKTLSTIEENSPGSGPVGWLGPGLTETYDTPGVPPPRAGVTNYIGDWVYATKPTEISTKDGPLITLPYSMECNDIPVMAVQHHEAAYWTQKCTDTFERRCIQEGAGPREDYGIAHPPLHQRPAVPHQVP